MANLYGPRIVTDGLVLNLDAGNSKSYPGSGSTWYDLSDNSVNGTGINGAGVPDDGIAATDEDDDDVRWGGDGCAEGGEKQGEAEQGFHVNWDPTCPGGWFFQTRMWD